MRKLLRASVRKAAFVASFGVMCAIIVLVVPTPPAPDSGPPRCATLFIQAATSPGVAVTGSFECLDLNHQQRWAASGNVASDQGLAEYAATPPIYTSYRYLGKTSQGYWYELTGQGTVACMRLSFDTTDHIDLIGFGEESCPSPLP